MLSYNIAGAAGSDISLQNVMLEIGRLEPKWSVICLQEFDKTTYDNFDRSNYDARVAALAPHAFEIHHPGPGSWPMAMVFRKGITRKRAGIAKNRSICYRCVA